MRSINPNGTKAMLFGGLFVLVLSLTSQGQTTQPVKSPTPAKPIPAPAVTVTLVGEVAFKKLIIPNGKPLLINFWATWCDPCREEFPDLVKLDAEYKGKIDFITISLDDPEDISTTVPKFLSAMKAEMPAYLLKTADESAVITSISKDWHGGMPFTALYKTTGELAYFREGKIVVETVRAEIDKLQNSKKPGDVGSVPDASKVVEHLRGIEERIAQAWVKGDRSFIERVLAEDWSVTDLTGRVLRSVWLERPQGRFNAN